MEREGKRDLAALALRFDRGIKLTEKADPAFLAEAHDVARRQPLGRLDESAPARAVEALVQGCLDHWFAAAADATAVKPRRNDLTVVDHQRVAGLQEIRQIAYRPVIKFGRRAGPHNEQSCGIARRNRPQRDPFRGQLEIE